MRGLDPPARPKPLRRGEGRPCSRKPFVTSGLRLGTPAATTRGFGAAEFQQVGGMIAEVLNALAQSEDGKAPLVEAAIKERVKALTDRFPIY